MPVTDHADEIIAYKKSGHRLREIAQIYGVSRERIRQICAKHGVTGKFWTPNPRTTAAHKRVSEEQKDARCREKWGVSLKTYRELRKLGGSYRNSPMYKYCQSRAQAKIRGIEWELSFAEWWGIWERSGKYDQRGVEFDQYCMTRCRDDGPYAWWNVRIRTTGDNRREYHEVSEPEKARRWFGGVAKRGGSATSRPTDQDTLGSGV